MIEILQGTASIEVLRALMQVLASLLTTTFSKPHSTAKQVIKFMVLTFAWRRRMVSTCLDKEKIKTPLQSLATMEIKE